MIDKPRRVLPSAKLEFRKAPRQLMLSQLAASLLATLILTTSAAPQLFAAEHKDSASENSERAESKAESKKTESKISEDKTSEGKKSEEKQADGKKAASKLEELTLNDIQDAGLLLDFIKEQCVNVYEEAARVPVSLNSGPELLQLEKIPSNLASNQKFLAPRQEWLVFFVGTIEPVVRQFGKMVSNMDQGVEEIVVPGALEKSLNPLIKDWSRETKSLNKHLDELVALFDDAPSQAGKIREEAVLCFEDATRMEEVRRKIFFVLRKNLKDGGEKVLVAPE